MFDFWQIVKKTDALTVFGTDNAYKRLELIGSNRISFYSGLLIYENYSSYVLFIIRFVLSGKGRGCEVPAFF